MAHPKKNLHFFGTAGKKVYFSLYKIEIDNGMEAMPSILNNIYIQALYNMSNMSLDHFLSFLLNFLFDQH